MSYIKIYILAFIIFFLIDMIWLGFLAKDLYKEQIGFLMSTQVRWGAAILFYCLFIFGLVFFAIIPGVKDDSWLQALIYGSVFGLICYATYDLTNLATIKDWPLKIVFIDLPWGAFISGITALITYWIAKSWNTFLN